MPPFLSLARRFDLSVSGRLNRAEHPVLDEVLPRLSHAADHSKLWLGVAAALLATRSRRPKRAAIRGLLSLAAASAIANGPAKWAAQRARPDLIDIPLQRRLRRPPRTFSFPSGHSASAAAFATAVSLEFPIVAPVVGALAAGVAVSRISTGAHHASDVVAGLALGAGVAVAAARIWPVPSSDPADARAVLTYRTGDPSPDGDGLAIVINSSAGNGHGPAAKLHEALPRAVIVELTEGEDVSTALEQRATHARLLGVAGGDGTVNAGAEIAVAHDLPLAVVPAGTLNHLARDAGLASVQDTIDAVRDGKTVAVDVATIAGEPFLNTASFGAYAALVDERERLEPRLGKWLALAVATMRVLRDASPTAVEIDGRNRLIWAIFIGNCRYRPSGFAPTSRERLDDGMLDVRIIGAEHKFSRLRFFAGVCTGQLARSPVYEERTAQSLHLRAEQPIRLARDGETSDGPAEFDVCKDSKQVAVFVPER